MFFRKFTVNRAIVMTSLFLVTDMYALSTYTLTPRDAEGPFYPVERQADEDNDLRNVKGTSQSAKGEALHLTGVVLNSDGMPQSDVTIEIWQTDANGLYKHPRDRSPGARDPFFQYWGRATTDAEGTYSFRTIIPGKYEPRPAHIHFKVWVEARVVLTSQMYIVKGANTQANIPEPLQLPVTKDDQGKYSGSFQIVY